MTATKKKYLNNLKNLKEENTQLRMNNEVMRRQLVSVRNIINEILGDNKGIDLLSGQVDNETLKTIEILKGIQQENQNKQEQKQPQKCLNCQKLGYYDRGFCFDCAKLDYKIKSLSELSEQEKEALRQQQETEQEEKLEFNPPKEKQETSGLPYKCVKCKVDGDDKASFKTHNGRLYCLDCLTDDFNIKKGGKK